MSTGKSGVLVGAVSDLAIGVAHSFPKNEDILAAGLFTSSLMSTDEPTTDGAGKTKLAGHCGIFKVQLASVMSEQVVLLADVRACWETICCYMSMLTRRFIVGACQNKTHGEQETG